MARSTDRKTAVITGGSGGIGFAIAQQLEAEGWQTVLVDLPSDRLWELGEDEARSTIAADLTQEDQLDAAVACILDECARVDMVVYCAGITEICEFEMSCDDTHRQIFEVNYFAAVNMARGLMGAVRRSKGVHVAVSSVAGFAPLAKRTAYAASKHALEGFFKSLRSEERRYGVGVCIAAPSFVASNPVKHNETAPMGLARPGSAQDGFGEITPEEAARRILQGVKKRAPMITVGRVAGVSWMLYRTSPKLYQKLMENRVMRV